MAIRLRRHEGQARDPLHGTATAYNQVTRQLTTHPGQGWRIRGPITGRAVLRPSPARRTGVADVPSQGDGTAGSGGTLPASGPSRERVLRFASLQPRARFAGRYRIAGTLGAGGTGEVYAAHDEVAGLPVALKVLYPRQPGDEQALLRLRRELRIVRGLRDPGILRVHDLGEDDGLLFLVMERLEGESLRQRLARTGPLPPEKAARILNGTLSALSTAHEAAVVHRDLKPGNLFLARPEAPDQEERVVLLDFGLARGAEDRTLTAAGAVLGTPEYISPEQARGDPEVGPASDVYSCGILLIEMLAGRPPFSGGSTLEILNAHLARPAAKAVARPPGAPPWLWDLALAMVEKEPRRRPRTAAAALARLEMRGRLGIAGRIGDAIRRFAVPLPHRRAKLWLGTASILVLAALAGWFLPATVAVEDRLIGRNFRGHRVRAYDLPPVAGAVPLDSEPSLMPRDLVLLGGRTHEQPRFPEEFPLGLVVLNRWTGSIEPFRMQRLDDLPADFSNYDNAYGGAALMEIPWTNDGEPLLLALYNHSDYPSLLLLFTPRGILDRPILHPGHLEPFVATLPDSPEGGQSLAIFGAVNNHHGSRAALFGIAEATRGAALPPFEVPDHEGRAMFYTFFSNAPHLRFEQWGEVGRIQFADGDTVRVNLRDGTPLDREDRDGLAPEAWRRGQTGLLAALEESTWLSRDRRPWDGAAKLDAFARQDGLATVHRGVALGRAATLYARAGRFPEALALADKARSLEPKVQGHARLLLHMLARAGRWQDVHRLAIAEANVRIGSNEYRRDLVVAGLLGNRPDLVELLRHRRVPIEREPEVYGFSEEMMVRLHAGDPQGALNALSGAESFVRRPENAILAILAYATLDPPDLPRALASFEIVKSSKGMGQRLPLAAIEAYLASLVGTAQPPPDDIEADLTRARAGANENIVDWYFSIWGEALAAGAARARGDLASFERHRAAAADSPGAGSWLARVIGSR